MSTLKMKYLLCMTPLILMAGGCGLVSWLGDATGISADPDAPLAPIETAVGMGMPLVLKAWLGVKGILSMATKRGWQNWRNVFNPRTGFMSSLWSVAANLFGTHSPTEVGAAKALVQAPAS